MTASVCRPSQAALVTVNFDDLPAFTVVTDQYAELGVSISLLPALNPPPKPGPFTVPVADVFPLASRPNTLEPFSVVGDPSHGGPYYDMGFTFSTPIDFFRIDAFDADEPLSARGYLNGTLEVTLSFPPGTDLQHYPVVFGQVGGKLRLDYVVLDVTAGPDPGPEYYDNLQFDPVGSVPPLPIPEPSQAGWVAAVGLAAFCVARRCWRGSLEI